MSDKKPRMTLLIIDDNPAEHNLYIDFLSDDLQREYRFVHAYTAAEGIALYDPAVVDCILLDYNLPDATGMEVLTRLGARYSPLPTVMLTGEGNEAVAVLAMKNGAQDYLPKRSLTPPALQRCVERAAERTMLLTQMERYKQELERSNRDLERFATVAAHDLKSPLRAVMQHLKIIHKNNHEKLDERSLKSMAFAIDGASRMNELIEALLEYSQLGFGERKLARVDCNHAMKIVRANLSTTIEEKAATITWDTLPTLVADKIQITQLLQNLVANAIKFCERRPVITVSAQQHKGTWQFSVRDNGIGLDPRHQDKIFTIFKRIHGTQNYPGIGVGLAICERVVKNHGGEIKVESTPGEGSNFVFTIADVPETAIC
jgi:signal transduction histidine kinase